MRGGFMNKTDIRTLLLKHDSVIGQLERASAQMMMIWKAVGAIALVAVGT